MENTEHGERPPHTTPDPRTTPARHVRPAVETAGYSKRAPAKGALCRPAGLLQRVPA